MAKSNSSLYLFLFAGVVLLGVIGLAIYKKSVPSIYDDFAQCVTDKGATFYGAYWCPHCAEQKKELGNAMKNINYVECAVPGQPKVQTQICQDKQINGYPTWIFADGSRIGDVLTLEELSTKTGCALPQAEE